MAAQLTSESEQGDIAEINITPLVDIMLVLLVIFMATSTYISRAALEVELPRASSGENVGTSPIQVVLSKNGALSLDGQIVSDEAFMEALRVRQAKDRHVQVALLADRGVPYGDVVALIDTIRQQGIATFSLQVEK